MAKVFHGDKSPKFLHFTTSNPAAFIMITVAASFKLRATAQQCYSPANLRRNPVALRSSQSVSEHKIAKNDLRRNIAYVRIKPRVSWLLMASPSFC
jgi:hypothetical protein